MGKKKKTLRQKRATEARRLKELHGNGVSEETAPTLPSLTDEKPNTPTFSYSFTSSVKTSALQSSTLEKDLQKTFFVSMGILAFLVILSLLLHHHAFVLPLISIRY